MGLQDEFKLKGVSVYKVSKEAGIPYTTLSDLVTGKTDINNASVRTLSRLSQYMALTMDELYRKMDTAHVMHLKKYQGLPTELDESINNLIVAIDMGKELIDCELAQVLGDINMSESWGLIDSVKAKELRSYYVFDVLDELERRETEKNG